MSTTGVLLEFFNRNLLGAFKRQVNDLGVSLTRNMSDTQLALETGALMNTMKFEPFYGKDGNIMAWEHLGNPYAKGRSFLIQKTADQLVALGHEEQLDLLSLANALHSAEMNAQNGAARYPITVNISVNSALSEDFWKKAIKIMGKIDPSKVIFELLEHPVENMNASIEHLIVLKKQGLRLFIDDLNVGQEHDNRLKLFAPVIEGVKIDGPLVRQKIKLGKEDPQSIKAFIDNIQDMRARNGLPPVKIVAEFVQDFDEARMLYAMGVTAVQGRYLKEEDFKTKIQDGLPIVSANQTDFGRWEDDLHELKVA